VGHRTSLNELFKLIKQCLSEKIEKSVNAEPINRDFRIGDVRHSLAGHHKAKMLFMYAPKVTVKEGLRRTTQRFLFRMMTPSMVA
jgi:UDP-N-acetylglucosamine/UDP-N-acetylgalactosamine 4-epimerase